MKVHPDHRRPLAKGLVLLGLCVLIMGAFIEVPALHFALPSATNIAVHTLLETASVTVSLMVFSIGWATFERERSSVVPVVSAAFLGAGILDFFHLLSFTGMPALLTPSGGGKAIPTFLAARLLVALAIGTLAITLSPRPMPKRWAVALFAGSLALALMVSGLSVLDVRVRTLFFDPRLGLTPLKIGVEYFIIALNLAAAFGFLLRLRAPRTQPVVYLMVAVCLMALSEFALTLYDSTVDQYSNLGHVFKVIAYLLIWHAMFAEGVLRPHLALERMQNELRLEEEKYRLLFENTLDGIVISESQSRIQDANPAACAMLGAGRSELTKLLSRDLYDERDPRLEPLRDPLHGAGPARGEANILRPDGSTFQAEFASMTYVDSAGRQLTSAVFRDVTERNLARDEIMRLNATLEERVAQRTAQLEAVNRALESFTHSVAHDLRSPLGAIQGFGGALAATVQSRLTEREQHYLDRIIRRSAEMGEMIDALLGLTHLSMSSPSLERLDLAPIANAVIQNLKDAHPERRVDIGVDEPLPVQGDRRLLRLALDNLIGNAWKFTARRPQARIRIGSRNLPQGVTAFFVEDNGAGFDMSAADKLFGVFQRMHSAEEFPGTGIGLANVSRIIGLHGGTIWAEARPNEGATFYFTLGAAA